MTMGIRREIELRQLAIREVEYGGLLGELRDAFREIWDTLTTMVRPLTNPRQSLYTIAEWDDASGVDEAAVEKRWAELERICLLIGSDRFADAA